jgi:xanthine/CO dehydrogenase XdhC/CoxF family maturation factor
MSSDLSGLIEAAIAASADQELYLTTVVRVRGSAYRHPGAHMLSTRTRRLAGSISGGCLEADVVRRAPFRTREARAMIATYETGADDDIETGFGQGCGGSIDLLIERVDGFAAGGPLAFMSRCLREERLGAMLTVIRSDVDSIPVGSRFTITDDGVITSGIELAAVRDELARVARRALERNGPPFYEACDLLDVLVEVIRPPVHLYVFGTGFDVLPVVLFAKLTGWAVTVCAVEERLAARERFSAASRFLVGTPTEIVRELDRRVVPVAVIMSHHYERDRDALAALLASRARYIGVLGPRRRTDRMLAELEQKGQSTEGNLERLCSPAGLDIGAEGPEQIALSIVAEIQAAMSETSRHRPRASLGVVGSAISRTTNAP